MGLKDGAYDSSTVKATVTNSCTFNTEYLQKDFTKYCPIFPRLADEKN